MRCSEVLEEYCIQLRVLAFANFPPQSFGSGQNNDSHHSFPHSKNQEKILQFNQQSAYPDDPPSDTQMRTLELLKATKPNETLVSPLQFG